ncbi:unnamed protein product, partial [marine sediment metagenome]
MVSMGTDVIGSHDAFQLTAASGALTVAKNLSVADGSATVPTAVTGAANKRVGAFTITAGAGEGVEVSSIMVTDESAAFNYLQNLKVMHGTTQIGNTIGTLNTTTSYTFVPSPYITLAASEAYTIDVYADVKTGLSAGDKGHIVIDEVDGTGLTTNTSANYTDDVTGQIIYVAEEGTLTVTVDANTPTSDILPMLSGTG